MSCDSHRIDRSRRLPFRLAAAAWLTSSIAAIAQCPMCKSAVEKSPEGQQLAGNLNAAILFLFVMPFAIVGTVALFLYRARRRARGPVDPSQTD